MKKNFWNTCSTSHVSLPHNITTALSHIASEKNIKSSQIVHLLLLESKTLNGAMEELCDAGLSGCSESLEEKEEMNRLPP